ncbi:MAG: exodeoxyribonuclease VII large subunit [Actinomycetes bacterium]|jgi:exodeoxyribonuclease VII large subunit
MMETSPESPAPVRVVSEALKSYLDRLSPIWIEGEISEINERSGMSYLRLRDPSVDMSISMMCHKSVLATVAPLPQNARVVMHAKVSYYAKNGSLSFSVKEIRQVGVGELLARLEALKQVLAAEGLFALDRKIALPLLPRVVGLICGRNSAAEKDVIENAKRRWPAVEFEIREVSVQGAAAVTEVSQALRELEADPNVEVIIITRGGGSFEDLLPFSDEGLVRLAASCTTPIVSAIGHEQDAPLLDLVADLRASTPTDAAKQVVPDISEERALIAQLRDRATRTVTNALSFENQRIAQLRARPVLKDPFTIVETRSEILRALSERSLRSISHRITLASEELIQIVARIRTLSPQATLDRGYGLVLTQSGALVRDADSVAVGDQLRLRFARGEAEATINSKRVD